MKKITILLLFLTFSSFAQIKFGGSIGTNFVTLNTDLFEYSPKAGFDFGAHLRYLLDDSSEVLFDVTFRFSNYEIEGNEFDFLNENQNTTNIDFRQISTTYGLYYNYYLLNSKISFLIGPSLLVGGSLQPKDDNISSNISIGNNNISANELSETKSNFMLTTGLTAGLENLKIILKYNIGLSNIYRDTVLFDNDFSNIMGEAKQNILSIALMYSFDY